MRKYLSSGGEVMHYWANKVQPEGQASNVSFVDSRLYSYRAVIGRHLPDGSVAISNHNYSPTTSRHQRLARSAARHLKVHSVPFPDSTYDSMRAVQVEVEQCLKNASTARKYKDTHLAKAMEAVNHYNAFATALGELDALLPLPVTDEATLAAIAATTKAELKRLHEQRKEREARNLAEQAEKIESWRKGDYVYLPHNLPTMLRVKDGHVETSRSAKIPVEDAKRLWPLIGRVMRGERDYEVGMQLGVYRLTKICKNGSIVVGCHNIAYAEIERMSVALGLAEEVAA